MSVPLFRILCIVFCAADALFLVGSILLSAISVGIRRRRKTLKPAALAPIVIPSEDLILHIRHGKIDAYDAEDDPSEPDGVFLQRAERRSFLEELEHLPPARRKLLDEFCAFFAAQPDCTGQSQVNALAFRYKKGTVAKAVIRRETVSLRFCILNPALDRMMKEGKANGVRTKPVEIRLNSEEELSAAKQTASLTLEFLKEEEQYRLEKRRLARQEATRRKRGEVALGEEIEEV